jgi:hypothetical protein
MGKPGDYIHSAMVQTHKQPRLSHEIQLALAQKMFARMTFRAQVLLAFIYLSIRSLLV